MRTPQLAVLVALAAISCGSPVGPKYGVPNAVPVAAPLPPAMMDSLWQAMRSCSGVVTADSWRRIAFYAVPGDSFVYDMSRPAAIGLWVAPHAIYLAQGMLDHGPSSAYTPQADTGIYAGTVAHEMIHDLLQVGTHPAAFWTCHHPPSPGES